MNGTLLQAVNESFVFWDSQVFGVLVGSSIAILFQIIFQLTQNRRSDRTRRNELVAEIVGDCEKLIRLSLQLELSQLRLHFNMRLQELSFDGVNKHAIEDFSRSKEEYFYWTSKCDDLGADFELLRSELHSRVLKSKMYISDRQMKFLQDKLEEFDNVNLFARFKQSYYHAINDLEKLWETYSQDFENAKQFNSRRGVTPMLNEIKNTVREIITR